MVPIYTKIFLFILRSFKSVDFFNIMDKNICDSNTHISIIGGNIYVNGKRKYKLLFHDRSVWFSERLIQRKYPLLLINFLESNITFPNNDSPSDQHLIDYENLICNNFTKLKN